MKSYELALIRLVLFIAKSSLIDHLIWSLPSSQRDELYADIALLDETLYSGKDE